jgi:hypothetical protein
LIAVLFSADAYTTEARWSHVAAIMSRAGTIGVPVSGARCAAQPFGTLMQPIRFQPSAFISLEPSAFISLQPSAISPALGFGGFGPDG